MMGRYAIRCDGLTRAQYQVACLVADGWGNKQIAAKLNLSKQGVEFHIQAIINAWELDAGRNYRVQITHRILAGQPEPDPLQLGLPNVA